MTNELIDSELQRRPFVPFRLHLVSGRTVDIMTAQAAYAMGSAVMVFHPVRNPDVEPGYDVISIYSIEQLEQLEASD